MDILKVAVAAWTAFLYAVAIYAVALTLDLVGGPGLGAMSSGQGVTILIAVAPAAIGLTVALRAWTPQHGTTHTEDHESSEESH